VIVWWALFAGRMIDWPFGKRWSDNTKLGAAPPYDPEGKH
jgi:hypothetical protein